ncbi:transposable element Tcb1 transposase [Trichonephila clavipes]|nr:transposable element Tcb1 transposase [Trichonephila clavipes]
MITNFFIPELNNHHVQELWFQQDGATCHTARATIDLLKDTFGDRLISRFGPVNWPSRSCDLTPLDYFLSADGIDHLHIIDGTLNVRKYIFTILEPNLLPSIRDQFTNNASFIFQQDSALSHTVQLSKDWYYSKITALFSCSGYSPDLNPVQNLWHRLKTHEIKKELTEDTVVSWHHVITKEELKPIFGSMKQRSEASIKKKK